MDPLFTLFTHCFFYIESEVHLLISYPYRFIDSPHFLSVAASGFYNTMSYSKRSAHLFLVLNLNSFK